MPLPDPIIEVLAVFRPLFTAHTIGRPRVVGQRLPTLPQVLQDGETA